MNLLALFDTILNRADTDYDRRHVEQQLRHMAIQLGVSRDVIEAALSCDRMLVVYEP